MSARFTRGPVESVPIREVVGWVNGVEAGRLLLPPIQRSVVWRNDQIINYWDSLLRGYPAGMMIVHEAGGASGKGRTPEGRTVAVSADDFHLFDGQQRLTTILLGLAAGQLNERLKLWVDLEADPSKSPDLRFPLRITSTGQPFGYQPDAPNQKHPLEKRRTMAKKWVEDRRLDRFDPSEAFRDATGSYLIDAPGAVPFGEVLRKLESSGRGSTVAWLEDSVPGVPVERVEAFVDALRGAMERPVLFQRIDGHVVEDENEYFRFFGRLGQGGTPLSNDELTYSIIKHRYPEVHDRMQEIATGAAGRLASEVNMVLAALRLAKVQAPWEGAKEVGRPGPAFVGQLKEQPEVEAAFLRLIPALQAGRLQKLLERVRHRLVYDESENPTGLPTMLLARLPHELLDVLLLMADDEVLGASSDEPDLLAAFTLYWLLFVSNGDKAAKLVFAHHLEGNPLRASHALAQLVEVFERGECARPLPNGHQLQSARAAISTGGHKLRDWNERFMELDAGDRRAAASLQHLTTNRQLIQNALLWVQRGYLARAFPDFDPTAVRDEDLPIDLDHLIPQKYFGFHWRSRGSRLAFEDEGDNFWGRRGIVGNSLGNYRWFDASENRRRGAGQLDALPDDPYCVHDTTEWNDLLNCGPWEEADVATFQRLIDYRSLDIFETVLIGAKLEAFSAPVGPHLSELPTEGEHEQPIA